MFKVKRFFIFLVLILTLISPVVLATDSASDLLVAPAPTSGEVSATGDSATLPTTINEDLYVYNTDLYTLSNIVNGNVFASTNRFVTNPRNNGGIISGNLFLISSQANIESDVSYSNNKDKYGNYIISDISSNSVINGNAYVLSDSFTLEAGSEIHGDLYIASTSVNIEQKTLIDGNVYIVASDVSLNGQINGSAYITAGKSFKMNYFTYISRDLYLNASNATLAGVVYRDAFINVNDELVTVSEFRTTRNLSVNSAKKVEFAGEVQGSAKINAKELHFNNEKDGNAQKCVILGNLNYATGSEVAIPDGVVSGEVTTSKYVETSSKGFSIVSTLLSLVTLIVYVLAIVLLAKVFAPKALEKLPEFNTKNVFASFALGFASLFAIFILFIVLCLLGVGVSLAFFSVVGYLFLVGLSFPLLVYKIADVLKLKLNIYLKVLIVTVAAFIIKLIPVLGSLVMFIALLVGMGQILLALFKRNKTK